MRGTRDNQAVETYVEDAIAAPELAGVALARSLSIVVADVQVPFHARAGGDGDGDGEEGRDVREHG